jgi:hypothetical protein
MKSDDERILASLLVRSRSKFLTMAPTSPSISLDCWAPHLTSKWCGLITQPGGMGSSMIFATIGEVEIQGEFVPTIRFRTWPQSTFVMPPFSTHHLSILRANGESSLPSSIAGLPLTIKGNHASIASASDLEQSRPDWNFHVNAAVSERSISELPIVEIIHDEETWMELRADPVEKDQIHTALWEVIHVLEQSSNFGFSTEILPLSLFVNQGVQTVRVVEAEVGNEKMFTAELEAINDGSTIRMDFASGSSRSSIFEHISDLERLIGRKLQIEEFFLD